MDDPARAFPEPESATLPASVNCVLARRNPVAVLHDLASARRELAQVTEAVGERLTYYNSDRADDLRRRTKTLARQLDRIGSMLYVGSCRRARQHESFGQFVSVHARDTLGDGGLAVLAKEMAFLARALRKLRTHEPFYVRVRDRDMSTTSATMGEFGLYLWEAFDTIALDISALNLSGVTPLDVNVLTNAIWSPRTRWPPGLDKQVYARSDALSPGAYLVDGP